jgi:predicted outer membrane repeat protein
MMKRTRFAIMFYIKRTKPTAQGLCPIYVRVTINHERIEFSISEAIHPDSWNSETQRAMVQDHNDKELKEIFETRIKNNDLDTSTKINLAMKISDLVNDTLIEDGIFFSKQGSTIEYCKFEYATAEGKSQPYVFGGAIYIYRYSNLIVNNCLFENNFAFAGGAIYCKEAAPIIMNNHITKCLAHSSGGAMVFIYSGPVILNNTFDNNNSGYNGGAVLFYESSPYVLNNKFLKNKAVNSGGAIFCEQNTKSILTKEEYSPVAKVKFPRDPEFDKINLNSIELRNTNSYYGRFINNLICENKAALGGGMALYATAPELTNITLSNNRADTAAGGINCDLSSPQVTNSIINGNSQDQVFMIGKSQPVFKYCNIEKGTSGIRKDSTCKSTFSYSNIISEIPTFSSPAGGDYSLGAGSECIDAGTPDTSSLKLPTIDLSGKNRVVNKRIDIGALEFSGDKKTKKSTKEESVESNSDENGEMFTTIFPNPNNGCFSVTIHNNKYESISVIVISQAGQTVYHNNFSAEKWFEKQINLAGFAQGVYVIMIYSDETLLYNGEIVIN